MLIYNMPFYIIFIESTEFQVGERNPFHSVSFFYQCPQVCSQYTAILLPIYLSLLCLAATQPAHFVHSVYLYILCKH